MLDKDNYVKEDLKTYRNLSSFYMPKPCLKILFYLWVDVESSLRIATLENIRDTIINNGLENVL